MLMPPGTYASEITLMLLVGFDDAGATAGDSKRRRNPFPLPLTVGSFQSPTGTSGPVYGYVSSTNWGTACTHTTASEPTSVDATLVLILNVAGLLGTGNCYLQRKNETMWLWGREKKKSKNNIGISILLY